MTRPARRWQCAATPCAEIRDVTEPEEWWQTPFSPSHHFSGWSGKAMTENTAGPEVVSLAVQVLGAFLFCSIFAFLWKRSGVVYFGLWSLAWLADAMALIARGLHDSSPRLVWLCLYALFVFVFAVVLIAAAKAGLSGRTANWRTPLRFLIGFPIFLLLAYLLARDGRNGGYRALQGLVF